MRRTATPSEPWVGGAEIEMCDEERAALLTLGDVLAVYLDRIGHSAKTWRESRLLVDHVIPRELFQRRADSITHGEICA